MRSKFLYFTENLWTEFHDFIHEQNYKIWWKFQECNLIYIQRIEYDTVHIYLWTLFTILKFSVSYW